MAQMAEWLAGMNAAREYIAGRVRRTVVDDDDFVCAALHGGIDFIQQKGKIVGFVAAGDNHRNRRCVQAECSFIPRAICLSSAFLPGNPITRKARSIALIGWQSQDGSSKREFWPG
ncbi:hypothetical protein D3C80_1441590 [compost metagenome]